MREMRVKLEYSDRVADLERHINEFLSGRNAFDIIDINIAACGASSGYSSNISSSKTYVAIIKYYIHHNGE